MTVGRTFCHHVLRVLATTLACSTLVAAEDWPGWRGKNRDGKSSETGLLDRWPRGGPRLAWSIDGIGNGYSTPSVAAGRIYLMGGSSKREQVIALNEADGQKLWSTPIGPIGSGGGYAGPRSTPTLDGNSLYSLASGGELACLDVKTGKVRWQVNLKDDFRGSPGGWMYSESVLIDGPNVICTPGGSNATIVALAKKSGKLVWKGTAKGSNQAQYASHIVANFGKSKQYITFLSGALTAFDARNGKMLWSYARSANGTANCSSAIYADGHVFSASGYGTGGGTVKLTSNRQGVDAKELFFSRDIVNHHGGVVLVDGYIYGTNERSLVCLDFLTGKLQWKERCVGKGSIAFADGHLYVRSESGPVALVEASPSSYVEKGRFDQPERSGEAAWPHPVIANGKLYLRDQEKLFAYNIQK